MKRMGNSVREGKTIHDHLIELTYQKVREIIIAQRQSLEMARKDLAELLDTQPSTALRYEKGTYTMNIPLFMKICLILELNPVEVFSTAYKQAKAELKKHSIEKGED